MPRPQPSITGKGETKPRVLQPGLRGPVRGANQASQPAPFTAGPSHFRLPLSPHDNILNECLCWQARALWGFVVLMRLPRSALGQAAEVACGTRSKTQISGPHMFSEASASGMEVRCPWPSQMSAPHTLHKHTQGEDHRTVKYFPPLRIGTALLVRKNAN